MDSSEVIGKLTEMAAMCAIHSIGNGGTGISSKLSGVSNVIYTVVNSMYSCEDGDIAAASLVDTLANQPQSEALEDFVLSFCSATFRVCRVFGIVKFAKPPTSVIVKMTAVACGYRVDIEEPPDDADFSVEMTKLISMAEDLGSCTAFCYAIGRLAGRLYEYEGAPAIAAVNKLFARIATDPGVMFDVLSVAVEYAAINRVHGSDVARRNVPGPQAPDVEHLTPTALRH